MIFVDTNVPMYMTFDTGFDAVSGISRIRL